MSSTRRLLAAYYLDVSASSDPQPDQQPQDPGSSEPRESWGWEEGDEIVAGRYALKLLGGGSDYEAYLAWDEAMLAPVVAKCVRPHLVGDEHLLRALRREADLLLSLRHPVVVRGFDAVAEGERPHVVMEHLEGPNLASLLRRHGPLPLEQLLPLMVQVCSAIHYLHTSQVVHLDVKPRNIVMGVPPRVIDLSIARSFAAAKKIKGYAGTDAYMAPEQSAPGTAELGPTADIWGIGATLFHAVAGEVPFPRPGYDKAEHEHVPEVRFPQLAAEMPRLPKDVAQPIREIVEQCLQRDPAARPAASDIVAMMEPMIGLLPTKPVLGRIRPRLTKRRR